MVGGETKGRNGWWGDEVKKWLEGRQSEGMVGGGSMTLLIDGSYEAFIFFKIYFSLNSRCNQNMLEVKMKGELEERVR